MKDFSSSREFKKKSVDIHIFACFHGWSKREMKKAVPYFGFICS